MKDISIIIVNWNTREYLLKCLSAVFAHTCNLDLEVIVVDNYSQDQSIPAVRENFPGVTLIENPENAGFVRANNQGYAISTGKYMLLLNTDAFINETTLVNLFTHMEQNPDTGAAGCKLFYEDQSLQRSCTSFPTLLTELWQFLFLDRIFKRSKIFGQYMMTYWDMDDLREVDSVMGSCMIVRRETIEQVGFLDENIFMYSEEVDLCYRIKKAGWKIKFVPTATAVHVWGGSSRQTPTQSFLNLYRSRVYFFRKHYGSIIASVYKIILLLGSLIRLPGFLIFFLTRSERIRKSSYNYWMLFKSALQF
jgi:GT2 family glycosyltransferase